MIMDASPGMLEGDRYEFDWEAEEGAHLSLTNQGFTKVHPGSPEKGSSMASRFLLAPNACIENMMKPIMLYKDASFENETTVNLGVGAVWMQGEVLCPGRTARGESFLYRKLDNRLKVYYEGELIHYQRQRILPEAQQIYSIGAWENHSHIGTFHVFSDKVTPDLLVKIRNALEEAPSRTDCPAYAGAALTYRHGIAVTAASSSAWILQEWLQLIREIVRGDLLEPLPLLWSNGLL
ncbi:urease accessory protein UreD [Paenibacillus sp. URB8-2]|uniref:urease accessory protein UreD n=1 Tax=Paenibacillus sp. URB8-2 TaxID=2741301 RepID=UPI0015C1C73F|nr:urease accessory protein UreD [Paenibacillus sp. URB8-2]BCG57074.1 hypothetical protein PUR_04990 [Paenibacillus sp. URB8-2]